MDRHLRPQGSHVETAEWGYDQLCIWMSLGERQRPPASQSHCTSLWGRLQVFLWPKWWNPYVWAHVAEASGSTFTWQISQWPCRRIPTSSGRFRLFCFCCFLLFTGQLVFWALSVWNQVHLCIWTSMASHTSYIFQFCQPLVFCTWLLKLCMFRFLSLKLGLVVSN